MKKPASITGRARLESLDWVNARGIQVLKLRPAAQHRVQQVMGRSRVLVHHG